MKFTPRNCSLRSHLSPHDIARCARDDAGTPNHFRGGPA